MKIAYNILNESEMIIYKVTQRKHNHVKCFMLNHKVFILNFFENY